MFVFERDRKRKMAGGEEEITMVSALTLDTSLVKSESERGQQQVSLLPIGRVFSLLLVQGFVYESCGCLKFAKTRTLRCWLNTFAFFSLRNFAPFLYISKKRYFKLLTCF